MNTIEAINVITWVISDVMWGSHKVVVSCKTGRQCVFTISCWGRQSVFTIGLQGCQNVITVGRQGHTKVVKGSHMSQKIIKGNTMQGLACKAAISASSVSHHPIF
jgi:hypothetical protein